MDTSLAALSLSEGRDALNSRSREARVLFFLTFVLAPMLAIGFVGGYGFVIWILQALTGLPGPVH